MGETAKRRNGPKTDPALSRLERIPKCACGWPTRLRVKHLEFAFRHSYLSGDEFLSVDDAYEKIIGQLVKMIDESDKWLTKNSRRL